MWYNKMRYVLSIILTFALLCSPWSGSDVQAAEEQSAEEQSAEEQVIYVSSVSGNDAYTGTADAPVATLAKAYDILQQGDVKTNAEAQAYIVVKDALAAVENFNYGENGALTYSHEGKVIITGSYGGQTYPDAKLQFNTSAARYFQCGGPTEITDLTINANGKKQLYIYGGSSLKITSTVKCTGGLVRVYGGYSYVSEIDVENTQLDLACDTLGYVFGSEGRVTGNVLINLNGTSVTKMICPVVNQGGASNPKTATLNVQGNADLTLLPINGNGATAMDKVTVNLYGGKVRQLKSGRGADYPLAELELNVYSSDSIPALYDEGGTINKTAITLSGVETELSSWNFPSADTIHLVNGTKIAFTEAFPVPETALYVEKECKLLLDKEKNTNLPTFTGEGIVDWINVEAGDDSGEDEFTRTDVAVVYVASTGSDLFNSGLEISNPVKTLAKAYEIISRSTTAVDEGKTSTIVLMDAVELTENFIGDVDYTHKGMVKITSYYDGVDYREDGAKLRINMPDKTYIAFGGPTILEKVKFARLNPTNKSHVTTNLYTGPNMTLAEEVQLVGVGDNNKEVNANKTYRFQIRSGNYSTESGGVKVHMSSGSCYFLMAASDLQNVNGDVEITVDGMASPWYITGGSEANGKISGNVTINVADKSTVQRINVSSTYTSGQDELLTVNITGGTVDELQGGRAAGTYLNNLVVNVSGKGSVPASMSLTNGKGIGTIENFSLSLEGQGGTYSPDWGLLDKLIVKGDTHIAIASVFENATLEVEKGSSVFLAYPNVTLPEWTGIDGAEEKGDVWLEDKNGQLGELLLSVDFEEGAKDSSGNGKDGIIHGDISFVAGFDGGKAVFFDNECGKEAKQYIDFGRLSLQDEDFTMSFWMKTTRGGDGSGVSKGTAYNMSEFPSKLNHGVLLSNQNFATPEYNGFSLINAGASMYFGSSLMVGDNRYQIDGVKEPTDDRWHQIVVTVSRKGMENIYVDGELCSSVFVGDTVNKSIDAETEEEHLILGADGLGQYGVGNVTVDNLCIYSGVMNDDQIQTQTYLGQTLSLVRELNERRVTAGNQYSQSAIDEIMAKAVTAKTAAEAYLEAENCELSAAKSLYTEFRTAYEDFLMGNDAMVSFMQLSDAHIESVGSARYEVLVSGLKWANELGIDAYLDSGDYSSNGYKQEIDAFWKAHMENKGNLETFVAVGNHEVVSQPSSDSVPMHIQALVNAGAVEAGYDKLYYEGEVNGYHVLVLSAYLKDYENYDGAHGMEEEQLQWLEEKLEAYCGQGKPVFVLIHPCVKEQLEQLDQYRVPPTTIPNESIYDIFAKYPDTIVATGHIHHGLGDGSGVFQMESGYHVLDISSFRHNNSGYGSADSSPSGLHHVGYFVYVYEDLVQYRAVDFATGEWLTAYDETIKINTIESDESEDNAESGVPGESEDSTESEVPDESENSTESEVPDKSEDGTESETTSESDDIVSADISVSPGTGDDLRAGLWLIIAAIALCVGTYMVYQKKHIK